MKRTIVVTGAPAFARDLVYELGVDPAKIQRVFRFRKREDNDRSPLMKVTFMTTAARDEALLETSCLRHTDFHDVRVRPSLPQAARDHRDVLYYGATNSVLDPEKVVRCVYNARKELFELRYLFFDTGRNIDRVDWSSAQGLYRLRQSTIGTSYGGVALQWRRLCGCVHEGAMARPWTGNGQFCSAKNCNNRRKTCTTLSFFRFPVKLPCM